MTNSYCTRFDAQEECFIVETFERHGNYETIVSTEDTDPGSPYYGASLCTEFGGSRIRISSRWWWLAMIRHRDLVRRLASGELVPDK